MRRRCRNYHDLLLVDAAISGDRDARIGLWRLAMAVPLPRRSRRIAVDLENERAEFARRLWERPALLRNYRGDAPLAAFLGRSLSNQCMTLLRRESRRSLLHRSPQFANGSFGDECTGGLDAALAHQVRETFYHACWDACFATMGAGAPTRLAGACHRGLLKRLDELMGVHIALLDKRAFRCHDPRGMAYLCNRYRARKQVPIDSISDSMLTLYANSGSHGSEVVLLGGSCVIEILGEIEQALAAAPQRLRAEVRADRDRLRERGREFMRCLAAA